ncbi:MAG: PstS family phosphate ABC transporter substrate-binding protein [Alphaproteobacteria bacterium]|nr:PstS family phosphate ABC transporter substrate-binding protein [Alphaproteobacteria bacterium]
MPLPLFCLFFVVFAFSAEARQELRGVGSSTVYPFVAVAAEEFGHSSGFRAPIVESTGTGGGFKLFCSGIGWNYPDFSNASRAIKSSEKELCAKHGITKILELKIGYDGIVLAQSVEAKPVSFTIAQIFKALVKQLPQDGKLAANPYKTWKDIDPSLPDSPIAVYGPPPTSGTRDAFVELVMEHGCKSVKEFATIFPDEKKRRAACTAMREDGAFIEAGENDNLIIQKLRGDANAFGIFGYGFLEQNTQAVRAATIDGIKPDAETINSGTYPISRPLFVYCKLEHLGLVPGMEAFIREMGSEKALSPEGYMAVKGLIPLHPDEMKTMLERVETLTPLP